ncbi:MAG: poly-beta-1,6-N-acetyl-D-glucosamine N-deacetylase PgaB [Verrucomicrobia bacterium]|nr:poly-beta-1,6-N-acetyl-D-glucosamine N-deacetylase PgaB [Verrucomicrobiota bacterium]MBT7064823.1 poly-beta-1,6-N-acetyl-D-glucosamine N-deacetylase PgaB [Verrucomicrobiota bacterium]MBT7702427.1 poly-beta-1,6-N-acetyl-D-glucosamine N-deacetylase PgaB [Verrucomicrobiota bacterium]
MLIPHCFPIRSMCILILVAIFSMPGSTATALKEETLTDIEYKLVQTPDDIDLLHSKGAMQRQAGDSDGAVATYERIIELDPRDARARNLLVMVLHKAAESADSAAALPLLRRAVALAPEAAFLRPAYLDALCQNDATVELVQAYEALPEGYELNTATLGAVAGAYHDAAKLPAAAALYRAILETSPTDTEAGLGLALTLLDSEQYSEALTAIQTALSLAPRRPTLLLALAAIQWKSGTLAQALDTFDRILEGDPRNADAVNLKAQLLCDMGCISLAHEVAEAHKATMWPHVLHHVKTRMDEARTDWNEDTPTPHTETHLASDRLISFCYYNVTDQKRAAPTAVSSVRFLQQIEFLRTHDYHFVSAGDVAAARRRERDLPANAVLLTFDHGYTGFAEHVLPILELYEIPVILSICPAWIEHGPPVDLGAPLMGWETIGRVAGHRLVTMGIEAEGLFELVCANPQGDTGFAATTRIYDTVDRSYETEANQRDRIHTTLSHALRLIRKRVGARPRVLVWSHGARSAPATAEAERLGFILQLGLYARPLITDTERLERIPVLGDPSVGTFITLAKPVAAPITPLRAVNTSLDRITATTARERERNITQLIMRLHALGATTIILDAYADADADGNAEAVYFPTTQMHVKQDILDHVVARLQGERIQVFLKLPVLSFDRPATAHNDSMRVMEALAEGVRPTYSLQKRYSPFHPEATAWISTLYRDLAAHVRCDGIVFADDAYLTDSEDHNPAAQKVRTTRIGPSRPGTTTPKGDDEQVWTRIKTETINRLTTRLGQGVRVYRPNCKLARCLFAPVLHYPESEQWLAQNYRDALALYDYVLLMAYVEMEDVRRPESWLANLVSLADAQTDGLEKTVFKLQAVDWEKHKPVKPSDLYDRLRHLARSGAVHMAYGPDQPAADIPQQKSLKQVLAEPTRPKK